VSGRDDEVLAFDLPMVAVDVNESGSGWEVMR
jgi:hypothetical protein